MFCYIPCVADYPEKPETARTVNYTNRLIAGDFDGKTKQEIADILDIDRRTLYDWNKRVDWAYITTEKRKLYAQDILDIDQAMLREGKKGDTAAAELAYKRFDGWVPTTAQITIGSSDDDLKAEAARIKAELGGGQTERREVGSDLPGAGAAPAV
mgnify:CR=1 FL=1